MIMAFGIRVYAVDTENPAIDVSKRGSVALKRRQVTCYFFVLPAHISNPKRLHYPVDIIAQCVRWYMAYALSLRNLEEMMVERGIVVDHSTLHRRVKVSLII